MKGMPVTYNCMYVRDKLSGGVFAVLRRDFTPNGIVYFLCDEVGRFVSRLHERYIELIEN